MSTNRYAAGTDVPVARSRAEVEAILRRYATTQRGIMEDDTTRLAHIVFRMHERTIRLQITWPDPEDPRVALDRTGRRLPLNARKAAAEAERRRIWRVLCLRLKATLEATYDDAEGFRRAFLADTLLPDGRTVGDAIAGQIEETYRTGHLPAGLTAPDSAKQLPAGQR